MDHAFTFGRAGDKPNSHKVAVEAGREAIEGTPSPQNFTAEFCVSIGEN
jgi:hypothetical protein